MEVAISVPFRYPVIFEDGVFSSRSDALATFIRERSGGPGRCLVFVDRGLATANSDLMAGIAAYAARNQAQMLLAHEPMIVTGGEAAKNSFEVTLQVIRLARQVHLDRQSWIIAVGGGAMIDAVGFAASMIHRGVRLIRVPTTVLAQNDAAVGVKNSVNLRGAKNFLGTFAPPTAVFNDTELLRSLPDREWIGGIAEAFKVALIKDAKFLDWLVRHASRLRNRDEEAMRHLINLCASLHTTHIATSGDPFEFGSARPLDFGHWAAHKLESLTVHQLRHGEAVAVGMAIDLLYAVALGYVPRDDAIQVLRAFEQAGLPIWDETLAVTDPGGRPLVFHGIEEFREHLGGVLHVTLPRPLGHRVEVSELDEAVLRDVLEWLAELVDSKPLAMREDPHAS